MRRGILVRDDAQHRCGRARGRACRCSGARGAAGEHRSCRCCSGGNSRRGSRQVAGTQYGEDAQDVQQGVMLGMTFRQGEEWQCCASQHLSNLGEWHSV